MGNKELTEMLHPAIKWGWRLFWTVISVFMTIAGTQASTQPDWVVVLVGLIGWVIFMAMPNLFDKLYEWAKNGDYKRSRFLAFASMPVVFFLVFFIFGLHWGWAIAAAVAVAGLYISINR